jgi:hypothetical protein
MPRIAGMPVQFSSIGSVRVRSAPPLAPGATCFACDFLAAGGGKAANRTLLLRALGMPAKLRGRVRAGELALHAAPKLRECEADLSRLYRTGVFDRERLETRLKGIAVCS